MTDKLIAVDQMQAGMHPNKRSLLLLDHIPIWIWHCFEVSRDEITVRQCRTTVAFIGLLFQQMSWHLHASPGVDASDREQSSE
jgi:hypothetical protein